MAAEVKARAKYLRIGPKKVNRILKHIRGKDVQEALNILKFTPHNGARFIEKVLKSAVANAENNNKLDKANLKVMQAIVDSGVVLKRFRAQSRGRGVRIEKPTSHITITLTEKAASAGSGQGVK